MSTLTRNNTATGVFFLSDSMDIPIILGGTELGLNGGVAYVKRHWERHISVEFRSLAIMKAFYDGLTEANGGVVIISDYTTGVDTITGGTYYLASPPRPTWDEDVNTGKHVWTCELDLIRWE